MQRPADEPRVRLLATGGRAAGIEVSDLVAAITRATALDGEAVSDVTMLERFALLSVPAGDAERVIERASGVEVAGPHAGARARRRLRRPAAHLSPTHGAA